MIDYRTQNFEEVLSDYDYVFDTMGDNLRKSFSVVKPQGKVVTLSGIPNERFAKEYGLPLWKQCTKIATRKIHRLEQATDVSYHFVYASRWRAMLYSLSLLNRKITADN